MNFLKSLIPVDWYLKLFTPPEDNKELNPNGVYLHIKSPSVSLPLSLDTASRYDVVNFIQEYHDNAIYKDLTKDELLDRLHNLFIVNNDSKTNINELLSCFDSFKQNKIVFTRPSFLNIQHDPDENNKWITTFVKNMDNGKFGCKDEIVGSITVYKNYTFPDEKEVVDSSGFD